MTRQMWLKQNVKIQPWTTKSEKKKPVDELYSFRSKEFSDESIDMHVLKVGKCANSTMTTIVQLI